jgi:hypothetical protein
MIFIKEIFHRFLHTEPHLFVVLPCVCVVPGCVEVNDNPGSFCAVDLREGEKGRSRGRKEEREVRGGGDRKEWRMGGRIER